VKIFQIFSKYTKISVQNIDDLLFSCVCFTQFSYRTTRDKSFTSSFYLGPKMLPVNLRQIFLELYIKIGKTVFVPHIRANDKGSRIDRLIIFTRIYIFFYSFYFTNACTLIENTLTTYIQITMLKVCDVF
jgi:hypothetical protein